MSPRLLCGQVTNSPWCVPVGQGRKTKMRWAPVCTGSKASCWAVGYKLLQKFCLRFRAKVLGMLLGEHGSACDLGNAFIQLTTASLEQAGSSWGRREQPTELNQPQACHRDRNLGLLLLLRMGLPRATPSLWVRLWQNRMLLMVITAGRAGKECPGMGMGFVELRDRHVCS